MPNPLPPPSGLQSSIRPEFVGWWQSLTNRIRLWRGMVSYRLALTALNYPILLRILFAFLRRFRPIGVIFGGYYIARHEHIAEVLRRSADFTVNDALAAGMPWGPFLLTTDWPDVHAQDRATLRSLARPTDIARIDAIVSETCRAALDAAPRTGDTIRIDFAADVAEPAVLNLIERYFGIVPLRGNPAEMAEALRLLSSHIMAQPPPGSQLAASTDAAIADLTLHIQQQVAEAVARARKGQIVDGPDTTFLERMALLRIAPNAPKSLDEQWMRQFMTGLLATAAGTMVRAASHILDRLLADRSALAKTRGAAADLSAAIASGTVLYPSGMPGAGTQHAFDDNWRGVFEQHLLEALRFRPMLPLLVRHCPRDVILGQGTTFERTIVGGAPVRIGLISGMFDKTAFEAPTTFTSGRKGALYHHFGFGPRYCFGTYVARIAIAEMLRQTLMAGVPRRAPGRLGRPVYEAAAVKHLVILIETAAGG